MKEATAADQQRTNNKLKNPKWQMVFAILVLGLCLGVGYWVLFKYNRVSTDDAYVMADSGRISSRIPGTVLSVRVANDTPVQSGQVLVQLDPNDFQMEVDKARAALARIDAQIQGAELTVPLTDTQTGSQVQASEAVVQASKDREQEMRHRLEELQQKRLAALAESNHAHRDFERFDALYRDGAGSEQQRDRTSTAMKKTKAQLEATDAEIAALQSARSAVGQEVDRTKAQRQASVGDRRRVEIERHRVAALKAERAETQAKLGTAELNLSYCTITAPIDGYISQKSIQVGDRVQTGQPLMAVVPLQYVYVEANYKETQLQHVRIGQPATIQADLYPGYTYHGRVAGIRAGTGAAFSLLPPENATGNWIKVVQRVPVKIYLDQPPPADHPLRVGLSLEVTIRTSDRGGTTLVTQSYPPPGP
jgi:membrane fusion protein (multidrug efflux system)